MTDVSGTKIAIVGAGPGGMVALKEFRELGYNVTVFEKKEDVGGVWMWSEDTGATTALRETTLCNSKYSCALPDFPFPKDFPWIVSAPELGAYYKDYAKHFDLYRNIQFNKVVTGLTRDEVAKKWNLFLSDEPSTPRPFDKVIWATGTFVRPKTASLPNASAFAGPILHSSRARSLAPFAGQNVVVLGIGNTAADTANALIAHGAGRVYLSHRRGVKLMRPLDLKGVPSDFALTTTLLPITWWMQKHLPRTYGWIMDSAFAQNFRAAWGPSRPEWGLDGPSLEHGQHVVVCSMDLVPHIKSGRIHSVRGIKRIAGPRAVEFDDGSTAEDIDAIIACTGYTDDLSMLDAAISFTPAQEGVPRLPKLYMNTFPPEHSDSFAYVSLTHLLGPQIPGRALAALALAKIWSAPSSSASPLPSKQEMNRWIEKHQQWIRGRIAVAGPNANGYQEIDNGEWSYFMHGAAQTRLYEYIGWGRKAWALWWRDRELYSAVAGMPVCAWSYRQGCQQTNVLQNFDLILFNFLNLNKQIFCAPD
ncbi:FAD/NAD(P)-binding domain-containing protein [Bimuria novae-zelandiae CBS 107.79]|uniref:FAD/NAD(P)-binding domain-containing protein n=1 Tax=Bimuria novae-zelandiae CBS 107.79 TaxID=1447943 RepID=A0A6A5VMB0_9PLEO|nr:FAD/NAD(P)-binding domain-containing protein [Bimuria novae-zelandiae CBS 107.79]